MIDCSVASSIIAANDIIILKGIIATKPKRAFKWLINGYPDSYKAISEILKDSCEYREIVAPIVQNLPLDNYILFTTGEQFPTNEYILRDTYANYRLKSEELRPGRLVHYASIDCRYIDMFVTLGLLGANDPCGELLRDVINDGRRMCDGVADALINIIQYASEHPKTPPYTVENIPVHDIHCAGKAPLIFNRVSDYVKVKRYDLLVQFVSLRRMRPTLQMIHGIEEAIKLRLCPYVKYLYRVMVATKQLTKVCEKIGHDTHRELLRICRYE